MAERMKISDARASLADVIEAARKEWRTTILTDRGKDAAAVVPLHVYEKFLLWQEQETHRSVTEQIAAAEAGTSVGITIDASELATMGDILRDRTESERRLKEDFLAKARRGAA